MIGSVLLVRATALAEVGELDEQFFLYAEETDWQRRAFDLGWRMACCPEVTATHIGAGTGGIPIDAVSTSMRLRSATSANTTGASGWQVYRRGMMAGALSGPHPARGTGPGGSPPVPSLPAGSVRGRVADMKPADRQPLSIVHVVVTNAFAGVERYVCQVVNELAARGHRVTTIGGDSDPDARPSSATTFQPSADPFSRPPCPGPLGPTGHRPCPHDRGRRGGLAGPPLATGASGRHPPLCPRSRFERRRSGAQPNHQSRYRPRHRHQPIRGRLDRWPSVLIPNGVPDRPQAELESTAVLMLQRLDTEKAPEVGIRAWSVSGLGRPGVATGGRRRRWPPSVAVQLARDLGVGDSVDFLGQVTGTDDLLARASILLAPAPGGAVRAVGGGGDGPRDPRGRRQGRRTPGNGGRQRRLVRHRRPEGSGRGPGRARGDRPMRLRMGQDLRRRQQEMYSLSTHTDRLEDLYDDLVEATGARRRPAS